MAIGRTNICSGGGNLGLSVTPQDVRMGKTFSRDGKTIENGQLDLTNLRPENIKKGVNIDGVTGKFEADLSNYIKIKNHTEQHPPHLYWADNYLTLIINDKNGNANTHNIRLNYTGRVTLSLTQNKEGNHSYRVYKNGTMKKEGYINVSEYAYIELDVTKGDVIRIDKYGSGENIFTFGYLLDFLQNLNE